MHSIIIPHRNRSKLLALCLWSIERSARECRNDDYEIIVSDQGSDRLPPLLSKARLIRDSSPLSRFQTKDGSKEFFCKGRAVNRGIEAAEGDVLTFLDADAVAGRRWISGAEWLRDHPEVTRLCYRVRMVHETSLDDVDAWFAQYDALPLAFEGYCAPEIAATGCGNSNLVFGNSQFSIRRDVLGDVRCDERYIGAGYEDLQFIRAIWRRAGENYKGVIRTEADEALLHIFSTREPDWHDAEVNRANRMRYLRDDDRTCLHPANNGPSR